METKENFSILDRIATKTDPEEVSSFFQDLNLYQIIDKLSLRWGNNVKKYYRYFPFTKEDLIYRRGVYEDIKKDAIYDAFMTYTEDLSEVERLRAEKDKVTSPLQKAAWHVREVETYCRTYEKLAQALEREKPVSEGLKIFLDILKDILDSSYRQIGERTAKIIDELKRIRFIITYDKDRIGVTIGELPGEGTYEEMLKKDGREVKHFLNPFRNEPALTELEESCIEIIAKKKPDFFKEIRAVANDTDGYEKPVLQRFEKEIIFYLSFCTFEREMENEGMHFATPEIDEDKPMQATGLYDLALSLSALYTDKKVVPNDFYYEKGENFFVLTGPNQGGKTTFARSLGQLVYFARMGLDVPAQSANVHFFPDIQTHFSVEESIETGRGKLKEELIRLAPMMADQKSGTFVIINELFTTAASYDAVIMGKKVLEHFIGLGCTGIYVTHLKELADCHEGIVSLRAMLDDKRIQTFKIRRGEAEDTPSAENLVNKYRLTYEQLKERL